MQHTVYTIHQKASTQINTQAHTHSTLIYTIIYTFKLHAFECRIFISISPCLIQFLGNLFLLLLLLLLPKSFVVNIITASTIYFVYLLQFIHNSTEFGAEKSIKTYNSFCCSSSRTHNQEAYEIFR